MAEVLWLLTSQYGLHSRQLLACEDVDPVSPDNLGSERLLRSGFVCRIT